MKLQTSNLLGSYPGSSQDTTCKEEDENGKDGKTEGQQDENRSGGTGKCHCGPLVPLGLLFRFNVNHVEDEIQGKF